MVTDGVELHPANEPIAFLLGTWTGSGTGVYPTIDTFSYREELRFWHIGKPYLFYSQRTWLERDGAPSHAETGFWRPQPGGVLEVVLAHSFGSTEVAEGAIAPNRIELRSTRIAPTSSAKRIDEVHRLYELQGDVLVSSLQMAAVDQPLQGHLEARLTPTPFSLETEHI